MDGRQKHLWISVSSDLIEDANRDFYELGVSTKLKTRNLNQLKYKNSISQSFSKGVLFCTYRTLISKQRNTTKTRDEQIIEWFGNHSGVIIFDECHKAKNICKVSEYANVYDDRNMHLRMYVRTYVRICNRSIDG